MLQNIPIYEKEINLMTYFNSKLLYVSENIKEQAESLYDTLIRDRCIRDVKLLQSLSGQAMINPSIFALHYLGEQGYNAITRGEVAYIVKCKRVSVSFRRIPNECYNELPVNARGKPNNAII